MLLAAIVLDYPIAWTITTLASFAAIGVVGSTLPALCLAYALCAAPFLTFVLSPAIS